MAEVICLTVMRVSVPQPVDAQRHKRRCEIRAGDIIEADLVTPEKVQYFFDGTRWGFSQSRAGNTAHFWVFITGCPDGTIGKVDRMIARSVYAEIPEDGVTLEHTVPRRHREWMVDRTTLTNANKTRILNTGCIQVGYANVTDYLKRKAITNIDSPDLDAVGTGVVQADLDQ